MSSEQIQHPTDADAHERVAGWPQAVVLLLQCTLAVMGTVILAPVIPKIIGHYAAVPNIMLWGPLVVTITSFGAIPAAPLAGYLADRLGRRRLLLWSLLAYAALGIVPLALESIPTLLFARLGLGVVEAVVMACSTTLIGDLFRGADRDRWLGYQTAVASISAVLLLALGGVVGAGSWRTPFLLYLVALPLFFLVWKLTWENRATEHAGSTTPNRRSALPWRQLWPIYALTLPSAMMFYIVQIDMSLALSEVGISDSARIGLITASVSLGTPVGTIIFQRVTASPIAKLLAAAFGLIGTGFIGMSQSSTVGMLCAFVVLNQIGCGLLLPTLLTWTMRQLAFDVRGRGIGLWQGILSLGPPLGPALVAVLAVTHDHRTIPVYQVVGAVALAMAVGSFILSLSKGRAA